MVLETHMKLCVMKPDFPGNFFCPKNWKNVPKMYQKNVPKMYQKTGFLNLLKNLVIN